jgi:hypothetical protein
MDKLSSDVADNRISQLDSARPERGYHSNIALGTAVRMTDGYWVVHDYDCDSSKLTLRKDGEYREVFVNSDTYLDDAGEKCVAWSYK